MPQEVMHRSQHYLFKEQRRVISLLFLVAQERTEEEERETDEVECCSQNVNWGGSWGPDHSSLGLLTLAPRLFLGLIQGTDGVF